jgi:hypothetical protein
MVLSFTNSRNFPLAVSGRTDFLSATQSVESKDRGMFPSSFVLVVEEIAES